ncbi:DUF1553 domain-containing protein [Arundinibacter roseus]|uniref:DUF1553 domain-containing protein n=1 Tax=Arundinibacter roseus TaxID=2070510 RepID=A0A4R4KE58_9BACT|nr:DUF1553 domain-containing protein [Arundinibacter roseus]TDB65963.1 DUF1553 domain-containing protein [Arundinibacter roseus]
MKRNFVILAPAGVFIALLFFWISPFEKDIDFNTEVKPILNKQCMGCHGGVKKAGNVSFLFESEMLEPGKSGKHPVVRGDADASEMIRRILTDDPEEKMPKDGPPLSDEEVDILKKWINQGAKWGTHWAYLPVVRPKVPSNGSLLARLSFGESDEAGWAKNEIDHFVLEKLKEKKLSPAPEADRPTLIRRVSLDLTGLPPTPQQVEAFVRDTSPNAYEKVVDQLLKSSAYGERWAALWMDLARYADTKGYERDPGRSIWPYRDYVIRAFNADKPYDVFTTEQLAGDLMPGAPGALPDDEKLIATGFHRNTMNNDEGGTQDEEFRVAALMDRVNTTWEVWQGTTFACVQCHSHPYDPIRHEEYYKYMAFFNNTRDEDVTTDTPTLRFFKGEDSLRVQRLRAWVTDFDSKQAQEVTQFVRIMEPKINSHDFDEYVKSSLLDAKFYGGQHEGSTRIKGVPLTGKEQMLLSVSTGAESATMTLRLDSLRGKLLAKVAIPKRDTVLFIPLPPITGTHSLYLEFNSPKNPEKWIQIKWVAFQKNLPGENQPGFAQIKKDYTQLLMSRTPSTPILWEGRGHLARKTHVYERGNWLVPGKEVWPDVPASLGKIPKNKPADRLTLARWIVDRQNPLTARVMVNRLWEQLFGTGIVETVEDFGSQGIEPTHRELLDWLAASYMEEQGWSTKKLLKQIVLSATYRQSSATDRQKIEKDPYNTWLSRGPRVRLSAEQVRDQALAVSGLLSKKMYGPGVMPPQPEGIWLSPYSGESWILSEGEDRYRRALYTYWKRTAPYPSMTTFDAPSREFCQSRRIRTNTPLQALVTLNDPVYLQAAQQLAEVMQQKAKTPEQQLRLGYQQLTFKPMKQNSLNVALKVYQQALSEYKAHPAEIDSLLVFTKSQRKTPELAALTITANVLLNLDEVVTKE